MTHLIPPHVLLLILVGPFVLIAGQTAIAGLSWPGLTALLLPRPRPVYRPARTAVSWT
jgi:hypothetical protein